jgi:hypothetical protein
MYPVIQLLLFLESGTMPEANTAEQDPPADTLAEKRAPKAKPADRPFPRVALQQAFRVPTVLKEKNAGNPWPPEDVAKALGVGAKTGNYFYLTAGSRDYGLTEGTRDTPKIGLTELGRSAVYPTNPEEALRAKRQAFFSVDIFRRVLEYYKGPDLPEMEYLSNTLQKEFGLDPRVHDDFLDLFRKNCDFAEIRHGIDVAPPSGNGTSRTGATIVEPPAVVTLASPSKRTGLLCFIIMPFVERSDAHPTGFFSEGNYSAWSCGMKGRPAKRLRRAERTWDFCLRSVEM